MRRRLRSRALVPVFLALAALPQPPARGQAPAYCNLTRISYRRMANAVQVTVQADGAIRLAYDWNRFFDAKAMEEGRWDEAATGITVFPFRITNARSQVPTLTDVSVYPVNFVAATVPPNTPDGLGVDISLALDAPSRVVSIPSEGENMVISEDAAGMPSIGMSLSRDQTAVIITVGSNRRTVPAFQPRTAPRGGPSRLDVRKDDDGLLHMDVLNSDLEDVLAAAARAEGIPLTTDGLVRRTVSLNVEGLPARDAISALADAYDIALKREGDGFRLTAGSIRSGPAYAASSQKTVSLNHVSAVMARNSLPEFLARSMKVDERRNALTIVGSASLVAKVAEDLARLDQAVPNVEVEASIIELSTEADRDWLARTALRWDAAEIGSDLSTGDIWFETLEGGDTDFSVALKWLQGRGRATIRSLPKVTVQSGQTGRIFAGDRKYIEVTENSWDGSWARLEEVDVGVNLEVTPRAGRGEVTLRIAASLSTVTAVEAGSGLPTLLTRNVESSLRVDDGGAVVIGGLDTVQRYRVEGSVPFISDVPFLGNLFRTTRTVETGSRSIFLLRSRIDPPAVPYPTEES